MLNSRSLLQVDFTYVECVQLFVTLWTVAHQAPLSMGFSRQKYGSGLPCPPPGDLPDPGIRHTSPESLTSAGGFFTPEPPGKAHPLPMTDKMTEISLQTPS